MQFSILRKELKALSRFTATRDIRYYLCGIHVVQNNRGTYMEATNGHMLGRLLVLAEPKPEASVIIGNDALAKLAASGRKGDEWVHFTVTGASIEAITGNERYTFQAVDGTFPDVDRIIPLVVKDEERASAGYNPEYLMTFQDAANDIRGTRKGCTPTVSILQRGTSSAIVNIGVDNFVGIVMPVRDCDNATVPDWCRVPKVKPETVAV